MNIECFDLNGKEYAISKTIQPNNEMLLDLNNVASGYFVIKLYMKDGSTVGKIINKI
jgi:hypothetical protein